MSDSIPNFHDVKQGCSTSDHLGANIFVENLWTNIVFSYTINTNREKNSNNNVI